ncbi:hypothetical protein Tco_0879788 [Tanacetum coccineum]
MKEEFLTFWSRRYEYALPHDLAYSDDEDLVNVEDDDGVDVMSTDVARGHSGDGGGDDWRCPCTTFLQKVPRREGGDRDKNGMQFDFKQTYAIPELDRYQCGIHNICKSCYNTNKASPKARIGYKPRDAVRTEEESTDNYDPRTLPLCRLGCPSCLFGMIPETKS